MFFAVMLVACAAEAAQTLKPRTVAGIELMPIPAGSFVMGSPADEPVRETDEEPLTKVTLGKPFWLGR
jgi:formylglycine-generating enzyme required for sulfatase activity